MLIKTLLSERRHSMRYKEATSQSTETTSISRKARLCVDYSEENSFEAIEILRNAGFRVTVTPVSGFIEPELTLGSTSYHGIAEIKELINSVKVRAK